MILRHISCVNKKVAKTGVKACVVSAESRRAAKKRTCAGWSSVGRLFHCDSTPRPCLKSTPAAYLTVTSHGPKFEHCYAATSRRSSPTCNE
jgi:hypothetical protein